jgi:hypothetical protein
MRGQLPSLAGLGRATRFWSSLYAVAALAAAGTALAIPGPTGELCGIASILAVAGLARLAGHNWGNPVAGMAATLQIAHVWPIVKVGEHSGWGGAVTAAALLLSLVLAFVFAMRLPRHLPAVFGRRFAGGRGAEVGLSAAVVMLLLALPAAVIQAPSDESTAIQASVDSVTSEEAPIALASADRDVEPAAPGLLQRVERDVQPGGFASPGLEGDAKAVAPDATDGDEGDAVAADHSLDLASAAGAIGHDEAGGSLAEAELVDALSGAAWQTDVDTEGAGPADRALGQGDQ